jgi:hypothetical protein
MVVLTPPNEGTKRESEYRFRAEGRNWLTFQRLRLPTGEEAKTLAGEWRLEVALDGSPVGTRVFQFEATSIRLRTEAMLFITEGRGDPEGPGGGYRWTQEVRVLESAKKASSLAGRVLRDELARRFPHITGPAPAQEVSGASLVINPILRFPPDLGIPSRLDLEISHPATGASRNFVFTSTAGIERKGNLGTMHFDVAAADLAFQAASNPEVLDFLRTLTQAEPE